MQRQGLEKAGPTKAGVREGWTCKGREGGWRGESTMDVQRQGLEKAGRAKAGRAKAGVREGWTCKGRS